MKQLCLVALVALTFQLGWSQAPRQVPYSMLPEDMPNPWLDPTMCRVGRTAGYICDPKAIITKHEVETLNWFLKGIANYGTPDDCPCSQYQCEHSDNPRFYKMAIALVPSLKLPTISNGVEVTALDQAQSFAYRLVNDLWNMSSCAEGIVILYSRDDKALVTMTGHTAGLKLDPYSRSVIHSIVGGHFADGLINEGLLRMIHEIELVLKSKGNFYSVFAQAQTGGTVSHTIPSSLMYLLLAVGTAIISHLTRAS